MISLSYNLSPGIKKCLTQIDTSRREILLTPTAPARLLELQWKSSQGNLVSWASLLPNDKPSSAKLKTALTHVRQVWIGAPMSIAPRAIEPLDAIFGTRLATSSDTAKILKYLDSDSFHPVLQAAIAHLHFAPSPIAFLVAHMYLCRRGYDCNGMVCPDGFWPQNHESYAGLLAQSQKAASITPWLEFYAQAAVYQYGLGYRALLHQSSEISKGIWTLSDRQKNILVLLDSPEASITNRGVQKRFTISQVTASRDLAKLVTLSLIYPHGRGRSVYYTRV